MTAFIVVVVVVIIIISLSISLFYYFMLIKLWCWRCIEQDKQIGIRVPTDTFTTGEAKASSV